MGSQISKLISVRVATNAAIAIEHEATRSGKSVKEIIEILGMDIDGGAVAL